MLTLRRCCLPGGVDKSEGEKYHNAIEKAKEEEKKRSIDCEVEGVVLVRCGQGG